MIKQFYLHPKDTWQAVIQSIKNAQKSIYLEEYIFKRDSLGNELLHLIERKAEEGVKVKLLMDAFASKGFTFYKPEHENIEILLFRPVWKGGLTIFPRTHRKLAVIDDEIAFIGGNCIQDDMLPWRDTMVEVAGELAVMVEQSFFASWETCHQKNTRSTLLKHSEKDFNLYNTLGYKQNRLYHEELCRRILNAKKHVYLISPYLVILKDFEILLKQKAETGVVVKVLLSEKAKKLNRLIQQNSYGTLLESGVELYYYQPTMLHSKMAIIDDWSAIGSSNLDQLSFHKNREINLSSTEKSLTEPLVQQFENDLQQSKKIDEEFLRQRTIAEKILSKIVSPLRHIF